MDRSDPKDRILLYPSTLSLTILNCGRADLILSVKGLFRAGLTAESVRPSSLGSLGDAWVRVRCSRCNHNGGATTNRGHSCGGQKG